MNLVPKGTAATLAWGLKGWLVNLPHTPKPTAPDSYPVPPVDVSPMAHQQFHHVRLVSQDSDMQGCIIGNGVWRQRSRSQSILKGPGPAPASPQMLGLQSWCVLMGVLASVSCLFPGSCRVAAVLRPGSAARLSHRPGRP